MLFVRNSFIKNLLTTKSRTFYSAFLRDQPQGHNEQNRNTFTTQQLQHNFFCRNSANADIEEYKLSHNSHKVRVDMQMNGSC